LCEELAFPAIKTKSSTQKSEMLHFAFDCIPLILSFINVREVGVQTLLNMEQSCSRIQSEMKDLWIVWYKCASYEYCNLEKWFGHTNSFKYRNWKRELLVSQRRRKQAYIVLHEQPKIDSTSKGFHRDLKISIVGTGGVGKSTLNVQYLQVCIY
jgi:hypothetical protein